MRAGIKGRKAPAAVELDTLLGWQGITARVPADWNLGALGGDVRSGYLRVDDDRMPRLEIKWAGGNTNITQALDRYLRQLGKTGRKQSGIRVQRETRLVSNRQQPGKRLECFSWQGEGKQAHGLIWRCQECRRIVIAQVLGPGGEDLAPLAKGILGSLGDHGSDGWYTWGLYGLTVRVPKEFELTKPKLMSGYLDLQFEAGRRRLRVTRWGMAQMALGDRSAQHWVELEYLKRRDVRWAAKRGDDAEHDSALLVGERRRPLHWPRKMVERLLHLGIPINFSGKVWHCEHSNRIYAVEEVHLPGRQVWPEVVRSIECH